ncbi:MULTISPECIES: SPW repeat protein [Microbispora]|uniref:SPW repeat protein n=1 Tax=Microbispora maris TaxID=3144104 RepID=A0ABV0AN08_9ACTN|nr:MULTISPECIES: SPW repeat protein [unclassified Microbispora]
MVGPTGLERHPDVTELRQTYDRAGSTAPAQVLEGLSFLAGLYLALSPWIVGFFGLRGLTVSNLVTGLVISALALGLASAYGRTYGLGWLLPLLGVWAIVSPFVVRAGREATATTIWNNVAIGIVTLALGAAALAMAQAFRRHERGERSARRLGNW